MNIENDIEQIKEGFRNRAEKILEYTGLSLTEINDIAGEFRKEGKTPTKIKIPQVYLRVPNGDLKLEFANVLHTEITT